MCTWKAWSVHGDRVGVCILKGGVCMGERECVCIWKGWSVRAWGEGGCVYGRGGVCVHGERECVRIWKGWSVRAWRERECVCIWKGWSVRAWREREGVYMEGVECVCMGRGWMCVYGRGGVCVHGERGRVGIWKGGVCVHGSFVPRPRPAFHCLQYGKAGQGLGTRLRAWGEGGCVYGRGGVCMARGRVCIWKGWSVHGERESVYMEGVECACMGRGSVCAYGRGRVQCFSLMFGLVV